MKSSVIVVEGQTEQIFLEKFISYIAQGLNYRLTLSQKVGYLVSTLKQQAPDGAEYLIEIIDVGGDESVGSFINENIDSFKLRGVDFVFGVRDLYTGDKARPPVDISKLEAFYANSINDYGFLVQMVVAIEEVEAWFLTDPRFFLAFDQTLTLQKLHEILRIDLTSVDLETIHHPAAKIDKALKFVNYPGGYKKDLDSAHKITSHIDLEILYLTRVNELVSLSKLVNALDRTLTV